MKRELLYTSKDGYEIPISVYSNESFGSQDCILYIHGFKGFKDWGFVPYMGDFFASKGMSFLAFNFSHNGINGHGTEFTELDKFEQNTFSLEVSEAKEVIRLCREGGILGDPLSGKLGVIGHSRGGGIAILSCNNNPDVDALTTWASVSTFDRFEKSQKQKWKSQGYLEVQNKRTGQTFRLGKNLLEDLDRNKRNSLNILEAARNLNKPFLILHGEQDETVPGFEGEQINIFADPSYGYFRLVPSGTHTFGATHPFGGTTAPLTEALNVTLEFFLNAFRKDLE